jgi:predicted O-methyltransferase YrrM
MHISTIEMEAEAFHALKHGLTYVPFKHIELKGKVRKQLDYCPLLGSIKRRRTFNGIRTLYKWLITQKHLDLDLPLRCLEIGSHEGQSASFFLRYILKNPHSTLTCVDPWYKSSWCRTEPTTLAYEDIFDYNMKNIDKLNQVTKFRGTGKQFYKSTEFQESYDFVYVDDNHEYEGQLLNLDNLVPRIRRGGFIIFDDVEGKYADPLDKNAGYHWTDPVKKAIEDWIKVNPQKLRCIHSWYQRIYIVL